MYNNGYARQDALGRSLTIRFRARARQSASRGSGAGWSTAPRRALARIRCGPINTPPFFKRAARRRLLESHNLDRRRYSSFFDGRGEIGRVFHAAAEPGPQVELFCRFPRLTLYRIRYTLQACLRGRFKRWPSRKRARVKDPSSKKP